MLCCVQSPGLLRSQQLPAASRRGSLRVGRRTCVSCKMANYTLIDTPVSNHSARVRFLMRKKGLCDVIQLKSPADYGGTKTPEYLKINPLGKFPTLILPDGRCLPESEIITTYLLDKFKGQGPDLTADSPEARAVGALVTRIHDLYMAPMQAFMYRAYPSTEARAKDMEIFVQNLNIIESTMIGSPFITGPTITTSDAALFPTMAFVATILPNHFGWTDVFQGRPKLRAWWEAVNKDPEASQVISEVQGGLQNWEQSGRWDTNGINQQVESNKTLFSSLQG